MSRLDRDISLPGWMVGVIGTCAMLLIVVGIADLVKMNKLQSKIENQRLVLITHQ